MNVIQEGKPAGLQWNINLDKVVTINQYKKITINNDTYVKVFFDGTVSHLKVFTDIFLNNTNNDTEFP